MDDFARFNLIGKSPAFLCALVLIRKFATCDATVLIQGATGTGKELAARAIHYLSPRRDFPFIPVNCGALPDNLVESELFGHVRGAFTDAKEANAGLVAHARGGTLFLDEIEAMNSRAQVVLLRFIQDKEYRPVGGATVREGNVRIVAASNADLSTMVREKSFRADLLFRLNALSVHLPLLAQRPGDVVVLAQSFLDRLNDQADQPAKIFDHNSLEMLNSYSWPGNVRELENVVQREFLLAADQIIRISSVESDAPASYEAARGGSFLDQGFKSAKARAIAQFEREYIVTLLSETRGNLSLASRLSGKDRRDIGKLLKKHGVERQQFAPRNES